MIPTMHEAIPANARAHRAAYRTGDNSAAMSAARDLAAAKIAAAIDRTLLSSGVSLKPEHVEELVAKLRAAAR